MVAPLAIDAGAADIALAIMPSSVVGGATGPVAGAAGAVGSAGSAGGSFEAPHPT
jgi:hypothetical protein